MLDALDVHGFMFCDRYYLGIRYADSGHVHGFTFSLRMFYLKAT